MLHSHVYSNNTKQFRSKNSKRIYMWKHLYQTWQDFQNINNHTVPCACTILRENGTEGDMQNTNVIYVIYYIKLNKKTVLPVFANFKLSALQCSTERWRNAAHIEMQSNLLDIF